MQYVLMGFLCGILTVGVIKLNDIAFELHEIAKKIKGE